VLEEIIRQAPAYGVCFGALQVVDSTPVVADTRVAQEEARQAARQALRDAGACCAHWVIRWLGHSSIIRFTSAVG